MRSPADIDRSAHANPNRLLSRCTSVFGRTQKLDFSRGGWFRRGGVRKGQDVPDARLKVGSDARGRPRLQQPSPRPDRGPSRRTATRVLPHNSGSPAWPDHASRLGAPFRSPDHSAARKRRESACCNASYKHFFAPIKRFPQAFV